ncbi:MAG: phospho-sugar mutase [Bacteroidales bacterium]|nr:phospho-sugar mutase [Bacteroidales bacterium]
MSIDPKIRERAEKWLNGSIDEESKNAIRNMMENDPNELAESFYCDLEFGTGGLRGIMGVGTNRMNKYTVGMATQGLANYLKSVYGEKEEIRVAIAYDCRNNSSYFARIASEVLSANGILVFLFEELRPTPELSFAVRYLHCHSGIVITASHNPKEYNGYKVYWNDGAQLVPPHDKNVIIEAQKITSFEQVNFNGDNEKINLIGELIDTAYLETMASYTLAPDVIARHRDLKIVYTPIHGTGITLVPKGLKQFGFNNIHIVEAQSTPDGNFPTVKSPNPEETAAMEMALAMAKNLQADLILATDPDADRIGVGVKDLDGNYILLNGNQTAALLTYYLIKQWEAKGKLTGKEFIVKTIVTSELISDIAKKSGVEYFDVLTGFKWIAAVIRDLEGKKTFIGGGEESYGYMVGDFVRDKDAVVSSCIFAECAAWAADKGITLYQMLIDMYVEFGLFKEKLVNVVRKGMSGQAEIKAMMDNYRSNPPKEIAGCKVAKVADYLLQKTTDLIAGTTTPIDLPKSDVLQFFLEDGSKISVRPSGTEPKIKFYFSIKSNLANAGDFKAEDAKLEKKAEEIIVAMGLR